MHHVQGSNPVARILRLAKESVHSQRHLTRVAVAIIQSLSSPLKVNYGLNMRKGLAVSLVAARIPHRPVESLGVR